MHTLCERLLASGSQALSDEELLIMLLHIGSTWRQATHLAQQIAAMLTERGGLHAVMRMDIGELCHDYQLSPTKAAQLQAVLELGKRLVTPPADQPYQITCADDAARLVMPTMMHLDHEQMRVLVLDMKNQVKPI